MKAYRNVDLYISKPEITGKQQSKKLTKNAKNNNLHKTERILNAEI